MSSGHLQHEKAAAAICGYVIAPLLAALPLLAADPLKYNFSGLLSIPQIRPAACAAAFFYGLFITFLLERLHPSRTGRLFFLFWCAAVLIPYHDASTAGQLHLLAAAAAFAALQLSLVPLYYRNLTCTRIYCGACMLAAMVTAGLCAVTGWAEIIYAVPLPVLLTWLFLHD